jgi:carbamoyl-phosphate synthase large subunit
VITVLVTGAGGGVGQGIIKSLRLIDDLDIKIVAADMSNLAAGLYAGDISRIVPAAAAPDYLAHLGAIFQQENIDYYFAGTDVELLFCAKNKAAIEQEYGVNVVVSPLDAIAIADDKFKTSEFLRKNGFYYPETTPAEAVDVDTVEFPVIVKPAVGCRSIGVGIAHDKEQLKSRLDSEGGLVVQELVGTDADEYTCTIVVLDGQASDVVILRRDLRAGDTFRAEPVENQVISDYVTEVALALSIQASCNFQLRLDSNGIPKIFEINCRFSGTTPFCAQLGFNPVEYYLKTSRGIKYQSKLNFDAVILRYWTEVVVDKQLMVELETEKRITPAVLDNAPLF